MAAVLRASDDASAWETELGARSVSGRSGIANFQNRRVALQRYSANDLSGNQSNSLHQSVPSSPTKHATESDVHQLEQNPQSLKDRLHSAMRRRIGPGTGLTVKMVARATGLTDRTIENAMSGSSIPRSDTMHTLLCFFDASFANEVFAGANFMVVKLSDHRAVAAARQVLEGAQILADLQRSGQ